LSILIGFIVAQIFFAVYEMAIDTILLAFCVRIISPIPRFCYINMFSANLSLTVQATFALFRRTVRSMEAIPSGHRLC